MIKQFTSDNFEEWKGKVCSSPDYHYKIERSTLSFDLVHNICEEVERICKDLSLKHKRRILNVAVELLQTIRFNEIEQTHIYINIVEEKAFMYVKVYTEEEVISLTDRIDYFNSLNLDELKNAYKKIFMMNSKEKFFCQKPSLNSMNLSSLEIIELLRKSKSVIEYNILELEKDQLVCEFCLKINCSSVD